jgi:tetratricopeptide (TPR) repeat protein
VIKLVSSIPADGLPPRTIDLLASILSNSNAQDHAVNFLRAAQLRHLDDFWINFKLGTDFSELGQPDEALRYLTAALAVRPDSVIARNNLGNALWAKGLHDDAIEMYREAVKRDPTGAIVSSNLGNAFREIGRPDEAISFYKNVIRSSPEAAFAHAYLAEFLTESGRVDEAIASSKEAIRLQPGIAVAHLNLGRAVLEKGRLDEGIACFYEAIRLDPEDTFAYSQLGDALLTKGLVNEAVDCFIKLTQLNPDNHAAAVRAAFVLLVNNDRAGYEAVCRQMLDRFGATRDGDAARRTCWACLTASPPVGDIEQLVQLADLAVHRTPQSEGRLAFRERGLAAYRAGDWQAALEWCGKSRDTILSNDMHFRDYHAQNLLIEAMALHQFGKTREARAAYDEAVKLTREEFPNADIGIQGVGPKWLDWAFIELLRREAKPLIDP